ncbi:Uma2 family endonuclease [Propionivibrio sp.]|uniref:Uma2 family endonuclease n=1 Tax=Propionivibrio sp. TaxID=2212460 RepID=UPI003BF2BFA5
MSIRSAMETYTVQDYLQWKGDWELIHGQPMAMAPSPSVEHQVTSFAIAHQLGESLDDCPHCQALFEIDIQFADDTVVRPDVLVICYEPESERLTRAPDLVFEVISPKTARRDEVIKFDLYRMEGVANYVLVYPEAKKAKIWRLVDGEYRKVADFHDETHRFDLSKCSIDFDFGRLWKRKGSRQP